MWSDAAGTLQTLRDLLRFGVSRFNEAGLSFGHGTDNAFDEAAYLILHALHLPLDELEPFLDARLTDAEIGQVLSVLQRRVQERVPAAYLTQEAWLGEFRFYVDPRVIVPRSHIPELLGRLDNWIPDAAEVKAAMDLCTGSGCLAILLAHAFPNASVDAVDISPPALEVAARNVGDYGLSQRVRLLQSDLFGAVGQARYDIIVSNPPYVTDAAMQALPAEYRHEPALALAAGADGLNLVRKILLESKRHLNRSGVLLVEVGDGRETLESAFPDLAFTWLETDGGTDRVFLLERGQLPG